MSGNKQVLHIDDNGAPDAADSTASGAKTAASGADRHFVTALARGLDVLSCFRDGDSLLANHEIAERCGLPKSTVTRLTHTLTRLGYLHVVPDSGKYRIGIATVALGSAMLSKLDVRDVARPLMQQLAVEARAMVTLATRDRLSMLYLENCRGSSIVTLTLDVGSRTPLGSTAMGRAWLAGVPASQRFELMERLRELDEMNWPKMEAGILRALDEYRATGCCSSFGDWMEVVNGIAVPFNPGGGLPPMVVGVSGPAQYFPAARLLEEVRPQLLDVVRQIEARLTGRYAPV